MKQFKEKLIVGIDHGYGNIKTANHCFKTGIMGYDAEPLFTKDMLEYGGRYYLIGEGHKEFLPDKIKDEDYYLLTLVAIAEELKDKGLTEANVIIAAGLPLTWTSGQKNEFAAYLSKNEEVSFTYQHTDYHIRISGVKIYPQGYAAVAEFVTTMKGLSVVADIGNEADRLNRMTAKLLSLTRAENPQPQESEIIYMAPTVQRVAKMLRTNASWSGVTFCLELDEDTPVLILEDDLYQIVFNLMENGIKYNLPGGTLTVHLGRQEDNAVLTVSDTGMGIPEDALEHIFERFYRVDKARSRKSGGSGLGLAIVRTIVQRNRGEISVSSTVGKGTVFTVTFPAFDTEVDKS